MDLVSIIEDTEQTQFCPQTGRLTDRQTDKVEPVYPPFNFFEGGYNQAITWTNIDFSLVRFCDIYQKFSSEHPSYPFE